MAATTSSSPGETAVLAHLKCARHGRISAAEGWDPASLRLLAYGGFLAIVLATLVAAVVASVAWPSKK